MLCILSGASSYKKYYSLKFMLKYSYKMDKHSFDKDFRVAASLYGQPTISGIENQR